MRYAYPPYIFSENKFTLLFVQARLIFIKFHDIAIGQRFELDGAAYIKTSPVLASPVERGAPRFMARYAQVMPLDGAECPAAGNNLLRADDVLLAFGVFFDRCVQELARFDLAADQRESLQAAIQAARDDFLAEISRCGRAEKL